jgi:hypothetical protein
VGWEEGERGFVERVSFFLFLFLFRLERRGHE